MPFFAVLPAEELRALAGHCVVRRLAREEMLFAEGDPCEGLFVVQDGAIKLFKMAETGREQVLVIERAGSTVGSCPIFDGGNFPDLAAAIEDSTLLFLPKREFLDLCRHNSEVAFAVIRTLAWRFRYMTSLVEELSLKEVSHRLARFLRDRALRFGRRAPSAASSFRWRKPIRRSAPKSARCATWFPATCGGSWTAASSGSSGAR